ncbi:hypothetical protein SAMN02745945_02096 [Peptoclostridium litorale DSM 5388]|uniref:Uncharacterized protein n=1 Tax=Peptoclostridium litorale DSM 5388 TaxID=1121324 RepID=A0A069REG2_PEPLI|nr:hypothetical protein [Peptoclostridium litorale]KDR95459.1 hypothetical protein CLIT_10c01860 [Peptoclostridium litorale DSM 5388]SIO18257.1 hypothetical protein SAMN02745945_02096 [Peptoclostridium litorale DSM 5388]
MKNKIFITAKPGRGKTTAIKEIVIGTICYRSFPWIDEFKKSNEIEVIELNLENRDDLPGIVLDKLGMK